MALTITEPATATRLTTLAAAKVELQVTDGADDAYLAMLIDQASDAVRSWCQRTFAAETVRETIHLSACTTALMLARWPIITVVSVEIDGTAEDSANVEIEDAGFLHRLADSRLVSWPAGRIVVEYQAGYVLPGASGRTLPNDVERAALSLVKSSWFARTRDPMVRSETVEGAGSTDYFSGTFSRLPPDVESLLSVYRNLTVR